MGRKFYQVRVSDNRGESTMFAFGSYSMALKFEMRVAKQRPDLFVTTYEHSPHDDLDYALEAVEYYFTRDPVAA